LREIELGVEECLAQLALLAGKCLFREAMADFSGFEHLRWLPVSMPEGFAGLEAAPCLGQARRQRDALRRGPTTNRGGSRFVLCSRKFRRKCRCGGGVVELPQHVLQFGQRFEVSARAPACEQGEKSPLLAQALGGDPNRVPFLREARDSAAPRSPIAMPAREQFGRKGIGAKGCRSRTPVRRIRGAFRGRNCGRAQEAGGKQQPLKAWRCDRSARFRPSRSAPCGSTGTYACDAGSQGITVPERGGERRQGLRREHIPIARPPEAFGEPFDLRANFIEHCSRLEARQEREAGSQASRTHAHLVDPFGIGIGETPGLAAICCRHRGRRGQVHRRSRRREHARRVNER
jgi:hypothetical protein